MKDLFQFAKKIDGFASSHGPEMFSLYFCQCTIKYGTAKFKVNRPNRNTTHNGWETNQSPAKATAESNDRATEFHEFHLPNAAIKGGRNARQDTATGRSIKTSNDVLSLEANSAELHKCLAIVHGSVV